MARVNIEERCFGEVRLIQFAQRMGWDVAKALGVMTFIWHDSQEMLQSECSSEDLLLYSRVVPAEESSRLISALSGSKYVSKVGENLFRVHGNASQIEERVAKIRGGRKGGLATKKRWKQLSEQPAKTIENKGSLPSIATPEGVVVSGKPSGSIQFNSIQFNPIQGKAREVVPNSAPLAPPSAEPPLRNTKKFKFSEDDKEAAQKWADWSAGVSNTVKPNIEKWADVFRKMREIDGVAPEDFQAMLEFVRNDAFWGPNAISVEGLRSRSGKNGLLKHENIRAAMRVPENKNRRSGTALDASYFENLERQEDGCQGL